MENAINVYSMVCRMGVKTKPSLYGTRKYLQYISLTLIITKSLCPLAKKMPRIDELIGYVKKSVKYLKGLTMHLYWLSM